MTKSCNEIFDVNFYVLHQLLTYALVAQVVVVVVGYDLLLIDQALAVSLLLLLAVICENGFLPHTWCHGADFV